MRVAQAVVRGVDLHAGVLADLVAIKPQLVLVFGTAETLRAAAPYLGPAFAGAQVMGCSTAGEISNDGVSDRTLVLTAVALDRSSVKQASTELSSMADSRAAGIRLAHDLPREGLRAVLILGQGLQINGSALLLGLTETLGPDVLVSGGLAGDGGAFVQTWVLDNQGLSNNRITCVGLYGDQLQVSNGSFGGWSPFGPARRVTRCENNVLFELDGESALAVYKRYLGEHAKGLPASGLLFPFAMLGKDHNELGIIRTILGVDEAQGSLTLAGEIDPDGYLKLMHASTDALVDGAAIAAQTANGDGSPRSEGLALMVSCVGRKLVMGGRVDEEVEAVADIFGRGATLAGFYSYGEIGTFGTPAQCKLHNQTMTITYICEAS